jgi:1-aminocyclopropane-1-carboxylate deaminase
LNYEGYDLSMLRLDLIDPEVSGNKWFKLKYNLLKAREQGKSTILTFGGAFSNHIAATAAACKKEGFKSIGIIRGEESSQHNATLFRAKESGMQLLFVSREAYRKKEEPAYLQSLSERFPDAWIIPEGGDNALGQQGCEEILSHVTNSITHVFCAYGTGTTFRGIAKALKPQQKLTGINVLKYKAVSDSPTSDIINDYHFGGYAKHTPDLLDFKVWFENTFRIALDYVYTAKLCYAVFDLIKQGKLKKEDKVLIIHSGGLQGNAGYEARYNLNPMRQVNEPQG